MSRIWRSRLGIALAVSAAGLVGLVLGATVKNAETRPAIITSKVVPQAEAASHKADWGEMLTYFRGQTVGTKDVLVLTAIVEPGKAVHRAHRHAEEEYLIINEGVGTWQLGEKSFPAGKSDILYVEPWVFHGLTNTGDKPLVFTVVRFNCKGIPLPPRPDAGPDEL